MNNKQISKVLLDIGTLLELKGENPFKTRAYANAARKVETWPEPIAEVVTSGRLGDIQGMGPALIERITELVTTGRMNYHEELSASVPEGLREMLSISGLGSKKVRAIYEHLDITTVGELEYACRENRLATLEGFGQKTQDRVLKGIELLKRYRGHHLINRAIEDAEALAQTLRTCPGVVRVAVAGDVRRRMEIVRHIDMVAGGVSPDEIVETLQAIGEVSLADSETVVVTLPSGIPARVHCVDDDVFPFAWYHWTGSDTHRELIVRHAETLGLTVSDRQISREGVVLACEDEDALYRLLGLQPIPPELREGTDEVARAQRHALPERLTREQLCGVIHVHTVYSDGVHTVREMAEAARERGYRYIAICDHSRSAGYAHGLEIERVRQQHDEIDVLNAQYQDFRILKGIESDILPDGRLDYPDDILATFDLIVASVHSVFNMSEVDMTERILRATRNPYTVVLGHPTGRLLLARDGYPLDIPRIIDEAIANNVAIEINANPHRLDMDWRHLRYAQDRGAKIGTRIAIC